MKSVILLASIFCYSMHMNAQDVNQADFKKLSWLLGEWKRTNIEQGSSGLEKWIAYSDKELHGLGLSLKGTDTSFIEKAKLAIEGNSIYYIAEVAENKSPVAFKLTHISDNTFICENALHDFPKKITYTKNGSNLTAVISGNGKSIDYLFVRKQ